VNKKIKNGFKKIQKHAQIVKLQFKNILGVLKLNVCVELNFAIIVIINGMKHIKIAEDNVQNLSKNQVYMKEQEQLTSSKYYNSH
jgi:exosome complex RNA-binding protein Rrp4